MSTSSTEVGLTALIKLTAFAQPCIETNQWYVNTHAGDEERRRRAEGIGETENRKS